ncbi:hypothetical protein RCO27_16015 [Sphingosinicella sp. LHD-64]|uniref:hypothetical protein n=1 Tax=Sphingosinicella sp. LHD-64 TaxID=3072139 RepID=UPI00280E2EAB|nr:hypothetical protein [Sphingosinicella sp. LHD-64]MDQ8757735.1 hypothetical protein [Sphingosinicella sp. LHD-64]
MSKAANPFNPKLVFGLIAAGIAGFAALLLLLAYGSNLGTPRDGRAHVLSVSATGFKGLVTLVGAFRETRIIRDASDVYSENLLVVSIEPATNAAQLTQLLERRQGRATLLILPKWVTVPDPGHRGWVRRIGTGVPVPAIAALGKDLRVAPWRNPATRTAYGRDFLEGLSLSMPDSAQVVSGTMLAPLVRLSSGDALVARIGNQPHYIVADPDLLNNQGLADPARARAAVTLIDALNATGATGVDFDVTTNGLGADNSPNLLRLAFEPPFLAMTLALVIAALLAGLHGAFRFGPARTEERAIPLGKAALVENSAGLIRLAGREANLGGAYADVLRQETARAANAPAWLQDEALDAYLDRMNRGHEPFSALAGRLALARDRPSLMQAARALYQWKKDTLP